MFLLSLLDPTALRDHARPDARFRNRRVGVAVSAVESMMWRLHRAELTDSARRAIRRHIATALPPDLSAPQLDEQLEAISLEVYKAYTSRLRGNHLLHLLSSLEEGDDGLPIYDDDADKDAAAGDAPALAGPGPAV
jgi:hypothetical protein